MSLIYKRKSTGPNAEPCGTPNVIFDRGIAVSDLDVLFPVSQIRLKPVLHDTSDAIMQKLTHEYVMINCVMINCAFEKFRYTVIIVLCLLSTDD